MVAARPTLLLSVDFEDWHQLVRRRVGVNNWQEPGPALPRQTEALLDLFDALNVRATFFVLGMAARAHPHLLERIVERGHEIGCHGDAHLPVHSQDPDTFAEDLTAAKHTIEGVTGRTPLGYRAPAFSITKGADWAYEVLADQGFAYDASQHDSPAIRDHAAPAERAPHRLEAGLWEYPVAVWQPNERARIPVGGASYWQLLPTRVLLTGLENAGPLAGLYLHPNELDPQPLKAMLPPEATAAQRAHARLRELQRNGARRRAPSALKAIARQFELIPYGEAHARLRDGA